MHITFIDADRSNIDTILTFMQAYYAYDRIPYDREAARASLDRLMGDRSLGRVWLILADEETVGYCVLTLWYSLEFRGRSAFIDELFVREDYRGKGIGTRALEFLKETAGALGVTALRLEVERKNVDAQRLYRKAGFDDQDRTLMTSKAAKKNRLA